VGRARAGRRQRRARAAAPQFETTMSNVRVFLPPGDLPENPLLVAEPHGIQREDAVRRRAAKHFSPAFVFQVPKKLRLGSGQREVSDGLIVVGDRVIVLQVKARQPDKDDAPPRAGSWIDKESKKALSQAKGTVAKLREATESIEVEMVDPYNGLEGLRLHLWPGVDREYFGVIVVDHCSDEAEVAQLDLNGVDFPVVRMRLDEWDYIVTNCDTATELWNFLSECGVGEGRFRQQREAFASSPIGAKLQPFPVPRANLPAPEGDDGVFLGAFQLPMEALISPSEEAADQSFRMRVYGCLLHEVLHGADEESTLKALAWLDGLSAEERREHERVWKQALDECTSQEAEGSVTTTTETAHLVEFVVPAHADDAFLAERRGGAEEAAIEAGADTLVLLTTVLHPDVQRVHGLIRAGLQWPMPTGSTRSVT